MFDFSIIKIMASIFTPDFSFSNKWSLISLLQNLSDEKFDGELFSANIPQDAPAEIPRVVLSSKDNLWHLEVSLQRINLVFLRPPNDQGKLPTIQEFGNFSKKFFEKYKKETDIKIQRIALVTERITKIDNMQPSVLVASKFCKEEYLEKGKPFSRTSGFEIHSLKNYKLESFDVNSWVRIKSAKVFGGTNTPILLVINDINTLAMDEAPTTDFDHHNISKFFEIIPDHIESIVKLYF